MKRIYHYLLPIVIISTIVYIIQLSAFHSALSGTLFVTDNTDIILSLLNVTAREEALGKEEAVTVEGYSFLANDMASSSLLPLKTLHKYVKQHSSNQLQLELDSCLDKHLEDPFA